MDLLVKKPMGQLLSEAAGDGKDGMRRVLGPGALIALGVGVIIGAGLFSVTGVVAGEHTGPAICLSFLIAAVACAFAGLCYAEFASMLPVAGSAYTYSYVTMGELVAWIIGWDLVLEYAVAGVTVSISWSRYFCMMMNDIGLPLPEAFTACPAEGGIINVPAIAIVVLLSLILAGGTQGSSRFNDFIVFLKLLVVVVFIGIGFFYINTDNFTPFIPENTGAFGDFGWSGVLRGAAIVFFAFLGFDAVSTAAQETRNPRRNMPLGILMSLLICTLLYMAFGHVMTGVTHYTAFAGQEGIAPVAIAIDHMGMPDATGAIVPDYPWLNKAVVLAILVGYCSVILVLLMAQSRIFMSMSRDGLLPKAFARIHPRFRTPAVNNVICMCIIATLAAFVPANVAGEMTSIGTLLAFTLVCAGVLIVRKTMPHIPRTFRTPLVPFIPLAGILTCLGLMVFLPADTWLRLVIWMLIGIDVYHHYGLRHSALEGGTQARRHEGLIPALGMGLATLCILTGFWHQQTAGWDTDKTLLIIAVVLGLTHVGYYMMKMWQRATPRH